MSLHNTNFEKRFAQIDEEVDVWVDDGKKSATVKERNGDLVYVEFEDGTADYVGSFEIDRRR